MAGRRLFVAAMRVLRQQAAAEDALQEAWINIWMHAASYCPHEYSPMTWMMHIVRNKALDQLRRHAAQAPPGSGGAVPDEDAGDSGDPACWYETEARRYAVRQSLQLLPGAQRQAIALTFFGGLTHAEVAEHCQVPVGTAKAWVRRGIATLRAHRQCARNAAMG